VEANASTLFFFWALLAMLDEWNCIGLGFSASVDVYHFALREKRP
jgi:hypothetical protein